MGRMTRKVVGFKGKRPQLLKVHAPRNATDENEFVRFVNDINNQFAQISERLGRAETVTDRVESGEIIVEEALEERLTKLAADQAATSTSESDPGGTTNTEGGTSAGSDPHEEFPEAVLENAIPTSPPPKIEPDNGEVGTTTDPVLFALSDHTHEGFTRATAFATPLSAGITKRPVVTPEDLAFRRVFLLMGA